MHGEGCLENELITPSKNSLYYPTEREGEKKDCSMMIYFERKKVEQCCLQTHD